MNRPEMLLHLVEKLAAETNRFLDVKGPGRGNKATNSFILELRKRAEDVFGDDFSEQQICGKNGLCVDYYFRDEATVVEIAFGLKKPGTEFEKDVLKAVIANDSGNRVTQLIFICKPGGYNKCQQPGRKAVIEWAHKYHGIRISVCDIKQKR